MKANKLTLNPGRDREVNPICPICGEKIKELSTDHENRFVCDCEEVLRYEIPVIDETTGETDGNFNN